MKRFVLALLVTFLMPMYAGAVSVVGVEMIDIDTADDMSITSQTFYSDSDLLSVDEEIAETFLQPHLSGNWAIVNQSNGYFEKDIVPSGSDKIQDAINSEELAIQFNVINASPYNWSDFHFEFYSLGDFTTPLPLFVWFADSTEFGGSDFSGQGFYDSINYWADPEGVMQQEMASFIMLIDVDEIPLYGFSIRQIATTPVPVPSAILFLGIGLTGFAGIRRRLNR